MISEIIIPIVTAVISAVITGLFTLYSSRKEKEKVIKDADKMVKIAQENEQFARNTFGSREEVEKWSPMDERLNYGLGIKEIRIINFTSNTLLNPELVDMVGLSSRSVFSERIEGLVNKENVRLTLIITAPGSEAAKESIRSHKVININTTDEDREKVFYCAYDALKQKIMPGGVYHKSYTENNFVYKITDISLPYGIFQVIYEDSSKNHIKLDLYSPYITREKERRSIFIYEKKNPDDYAYFSNNFDQIMMNALTPAQEEKFAQQWMAKARTYYKCKEMV